MTRANKKLVTIFGGSGFVGTQVVQELAREGYRIRVAVRRPDLAGHLKPLGSVGQIQPIQANIRNVASIERAVDGANIVINLAGIGHEHGRQRFRAVHTMGAKNVAEAAKAAGAETLVHMSALGADAQSHSSFFKSKAMGESEVLKAFPDAIVLRPSAIFGTADKFFNRLAFMVRFLPILPLADGNARFQPVYVGDVAKACSLAAEGKVKPAKIYELGGPETETLRQLVQRTLRETCRSNPIVPMPMMAIKLKTFFLQLLPSPTLTVDRLVRLETDNVVSEEAQGQKRTLVAFGISATSMDAILPTYLWRFRKHGQFEKVQA